MASFASPSKPRLRFDQRDSPIISAEYEIVSGKRGVFFGDFARHEQSSEYPCESNLEAGASKVLRVVSSSSASGSRSVGSG